MRKFVSVTLLAISLVFVALPQAAAQSLIRDAEIEKILRDYTNPLLLKAGLDPNDVRIYIVNDSSLNAFVTSGQNIFLHTGLIQKVENANQLKGVIAHEAGHIAGGHLARSTEAMRVASRPAWITLGLGVLAIAAGAGDAGAALIAGSQQMAMLSYFRHTRVQESAADQAGLSYLEETGQSGQGLIDFFENYRYQEVLSEARRYQYFRTHPLSSDRIEALRRRVNDNEGSLAYDKTDEDDLALARMQAKLFGFLEPPTRVFHKYPLEDTSLEARYARAVAAFRNADLTTSQKELQAMIELEPENAYFYELLGQAFFESGKIEDSIEPNRIALEKLPGNALLKVNLARSLIAMEKLEYLDEATELLESALQTERDNGFAWAQLAIAYDMKGNEGRAQLATAEQAFWLGAYERAHMFAERAKHQLDKGDPSWRRASDISIITDPKLKGRRDPRGQRG